MATGKRIARFAITSLLSTMGTIIVGFVFFQLAVFEANNSAFQFVIMGIVGGVIFSTFRFLSKRQATISITLLLVLDLILQRSTMWRFMPRDVLYYFGFTITLFLFAHYYFDRLRGMVIGRVLVLSSIIALSYIAITIFLYFIFLISSNGFRFDLLQMIYFNLAQGFLIGLGLGTGIEVAEIFLKRGII